MVDIEPDSADPPRPVRGAVPVVVEQDGDPTQLTGPRRVYGGAAPEPGPDAVRVGGPLASLIGRTLAGRYEVDAVIGRRATGIAYRANDLAWPSTGALRRRVTVTVLDPEVGDDPEAVARLLRTAGRVRDLGHPALDAVREVIRDADLMLAVSDHRAGRTLSSLLGVGPGAGWPLRVVLPIGHRIADGLSLAHRAGLVHGDLGLETVVLTAEDEVLVLDLGAGVAGDPRDDIVGLARIVHALLAGTPEAAAVARPPGLRESAWQALRQGLSADRSAVPADAVAFMVSLEDPGWLGRLVGRRPR